MDLNNTIRNLSLWEVKAYVRKAQNAVWNLSDIEIKVREATNNEPWGPSNTLMAEIARGFTYKDRDEICNMLFKRLTEKSGNEWRQIYKSLKLLEYLVKNGNEAIVDDVKGRLRLISALKSFRYIDSKGVDQGINVRSKAQKLTDLLNDETKIKAERKKAKENKKQFDAISSVSFRSGECNNRTVGSTCVFADNIGEYEKAPAQNVIGPTMTTHEGDLLHDEFDEFDDFQKTTAAPNPTTTNNTISDNTSNDINKSINTPSDVPKTGANSDLFNSLISDAKAFSSPAANTASQNLNSAPAANPFSLLDL